MGAYSFPRAAYNANTFVKLLLHVYWRTRDDSDSNSSEKSDEKSSLSLDPHYSTYARVLTLEYLRYSTYATVLTL